MIKMAKTKTDEAKKLLEAENTFALIRGKGTVVHTHVTTHVNISHVVHGIKHVVSTLQPTSYRVLKRDS